MRRINTVYKMGYIHNHTDRGNSIDYWFTTHSSKNKQWWRFNTRYNGYKSDCLECKLLEFIINVRWMIDRANRKWEND